MRLHECSLMGFHVSIAWFSISISSIFCPLWCHIFKLVHAQQPNLWYHSTKFIWCRNQQESDKNRCWCHITNSRHRGTWWWPQALIRNAIDLNWNEIIINLYLMCRRSRQFTSSCRSRCRSSIIQKMNFYLGFRS